MHSKPTTTTLLPAVAGALALALCAAPARGQVIVPPTPANGLSVAVTASVTYNSASGLYTYAYTVANDAGSQQHAWLFALQFSGAATNVSSPAGWTPAQHDDRPIMSWAATETGPLPLDFVDDGNVPPSPFTIAPTSTLGGFSFQSPHPRPGACRSSSRVRRSSPRLPETSPTFRSKGRRYRISRRTAMPTRPWALCRLIRRRSSRAAGGRQWTASWCSSTSRTATPGFRPWASSSGSASVARR